MVCHVDLTSKFSAFNTGFQFLGRSFLEKVSQDPVQQAWPPEKLGCGPQTSAVAEPKNVITNKIGE